jgi:hypothetical protein
MRSSKTAEMLLSSCLAPVLTHCTCMMPCSSLTEPAGLEHMERHAHGILNVGYL